MQNQSNHEITFDTQMKTALSHTDGRHCLCGRKVGEFSVVQDASVSAIREDSQRGWCQRVAD